MTVQWTPVGNVRGPQGPPGPSWENAVFSHGGPLMVKAGQYPFPITGGTFRVVAVAAAVGSPPQGAAAVIDVNVNGVSIYPSLAAQPRIPVDATLAEPAAHTATTVTDGDLLTVDIDQTGSTVPGANLVVNVRLERV